MERVISKPSVTRDCCSSGNTFFSHPTLIIIHVHWSVREESDHGEARESDRSLIPDVQREDVPSFSRIITLKAPLDNVNNNKSLKTMRKLLNLSDVVGK